MNQTVTLTINTTPHVALQILDIMNGQMAREVETPQQAVVSTPDSAGATKSTTRKAPAKTVEDKGDTGVTTPAKEGVQDGPTLDYGKDVRPKIIAAVGRLSKMTDPNEAKSQVLAKIATFKDTDGNPASHGEKVQPSDWPALIAAVAKLG